MDDNAMAEMLKLYTGYKFTPNKIELLYHLMKKILEHPVPFDAITIVDDLYSKSPHQLPFSNFRVGWENEWYFYTTRPNCKLVTDDGYYSVSMEDEVTKGNEVVGFRRILTYYQGRPPKGIKTNWIIHELRVHPRIFQANKLDDTTRAKIASFVACRVILTVSDMKD